MAQSEQHDNHAGSAKSWLAVSTILIGFTIGGIGLTAGPNWVVVWVGVGICAVGALFALAVDIFSDVIVDVPRQVPVRDHHSPFERHS